jgi:hypothetical protein
VRYDHEAIRLVKEAVEDRLLAIPGVNFVEVSEKHSGGRPTGELSITVHLTKKKPAAQLPADERIPPKIDGIQTDVVEGGPIRIIADPYQGGTEVTSKSSLGGTLGCFATMADGTHAPVLLTNQHVLFPGKDVTKRDFEVGPIVCSICSACCSEIIAKVPADAARVFAVLSDLVDGAIAVLNPGVQWLAEVKDVGTVTGTHNVTAGDVNTLAVQKTGEKTGHTTGTVKSITVSGNARLPNGAVHRKMRNQIRIEAGSGAFADHGDSGSLVLNNSREAVGLLFGVVDEGSTAGQGFASRIGDVTAALQINIATATAAGQVNTVPGAVPMDALDPETLAAARERERAMQYLREAQEQILETERGRQYAEMVRRHNFEIRRLINTNRRVALGWRRNHGPEIVARLLDGLRSRKLELPAFVNGHPVAQCLDNMAAIIARHASLQLRTDLGRIHRELSRFVGLTPERFLLELRQSG